MLTPTSSISDIRQWIHEKRYLTEGCHSVSSSCALALVIDDALTADQEKALIDAIQIPPPGSIVFKYGTRSFVAASPVADIQLAHKYYHRLSIRRQLGYTMLGTRCMNAWIAGRVFTQIGVPTPAPIGIFENRTYQFFADTSLLSTEISEGIPLSSFLKKHIENSELIQTVANNCRAIFDLFEKHRIYHRDTTPKNFIVSENGSVSVIDLDAVEIGLPKKTWNMKHKKDIYSISYAWRNHVSEAKPFFSHLFPEY